MKEGKVGKVMHEFKEGTLRSGSKHGPKVTSHDQALAIGLSEARKAGESVPKKAKKTVHHSPAMTEINRHMQHTSGGSVMEHCKYGKQ